MIHRLGDSSESDAELVLVYTNAAAAANKLRSTIPFQARVLVVGGGAGGYGASSGALYPGGVRGFRAFRGENG